MTGAEQLEWHQTPGNYVFNVFDTIPLIPLPVITTRTILPNEGATNLL
jgi:hypothetical protein